MRPRLCTQTEPQAGRHSHTRTYIRQDGTDAISTGAIWMDPRGFSSRCAKPFVVAMTAGRSALVYSPFPRAPPAPRGRGIPPARGGVEEGDGAVHGAGREEAAVGAVGDRHDELAVLRLELRLCGAGRAAETESRLGHLG